MDQKQLERKVRTLELLHRVGIALSAEQNKDRLIETILLEAKALCNADGGTLYLRTEEDRLRFAIMRTDSLGIALGGTTGAPISLSPVPLYDPTSGAPNRANVASSAALLGRSINIPDAYDARGFDFSGTKAFDAKNGYRSKSLLAIPMVNGEDYVIGVLQLLNARDETSGEVIAFDPEHQQIVEALASQAGLALDNQLLLDGQKQLLESFIKMIASAIDAKSPYTGGHCERVPILTEMLMESICAEDSGPFASFQLTDEEWYELRIAAWLHDCGKVTTPVHIMDKATKLEAISDRIEVVRARFELLEKEWELDRLRAQLGGKADGAALAQAHAARVRELRDDLAFVERANIGGEFLSEADRARLCAIAERRVGVGAASRPLLSPEELACLSVSRGTLTEAERLVINGHMVHTIAMLEALPFPRNLRRVPEYAGGHHEKMDGSGYPKGIYAGDMSVPARAMAIADVFEALTAQDRPYKPGKKLSEALRIMALMKRDNHLDPELLDHFVRSGVYRRYAERFLPGELIDEADEAALLAVAPRPFEPPSEALRKERTQGFLPAYRALLDRG